MRYTKQEKMEVIRIVERSELSLKRTIKELHISKSTFYNWYNKYLEQGPDGLEDKKSRSSWNKIPESYRAKVIEVALDRTEDSPREIATFMTDNSGHFISESSVYRILKAANLITSPNHILIKASNEFKDKTTRINQMWQTDFTYFKIEGWGWYFLSSIMDDYSRFIIHHELCSSMKTPDVERNVETALRKTGLPKGKDINAYNVVFIKGFGAGFASNKKFIVLIEQMVLEFYEGIVQHMTNWKRPAPKLEQTHESLV